MDFEIEQPENGWIRLAHQVGQADEQALKLQWWLEFDYTVEVLARFAGLTGLPRSKRFIGLKGLSGA